MNIAERKNDFPSKKKASLYSFIWLLYVKECHWRALKIKTSAIAEHEPLGLSSLTYFKN